MFCCSNCFADSEIKAIIDNNNTIGKCDFCGSKDVNVYEIGKDQIISDLFDDLLDIYTPEESLPDSFQKDQTDFIKYILCNDWHIFNLGSDDTYKLLVAISNERYEEQPELFNTRVGILQSQDKNYLRENSILKNYCWKDFVEGIKGENRFHSHYIDTDNLLIYLRCIKKLHKSGEAFYRSRICPNEEGYSQNEMGAPPNIKTKGGRVNPTGISMLYLADSEDTTLHEIRAGIYDYVTVGRFLLRKDISIINLADINNISPFIGINYDFDFTQYAINIEHLRMISQEIAKPLRNDNALDYLPTQYISDYIKSKGYDGIEYISTMHKGGVNLAVFDRDIFECVETKVYDVKSIDYDYEPI